MRRFSVGTSIGEGFSLVARRPLSVFVWGLLLLAPTFGAFALILPAMGEVIARMPVEDATSAGDGPLPQVVAEMMQVQLASMLLNLGQLVMMAIVYTAIFRAVLRPAERSVFAVRLGMDELRVAVVGLAIGIGLYAAMIVLVLLVAALGFALWSGDTVVAVWSMAVCALLALLGIFWVMARVSMMAPASLLYRDFAFVQGWRLAAGNSWPLFGMMLLILVMILIIELALMLVVVIGFSAFAAGGGLAGAVTQNANPLLGIGAWLAANWYWALIGGAVASFLYGVVLTLAVAPFASACRQLADSASAKIADQAGSLAPAQ